MKRTALNHSIFTASLCFAFIAPAYAANVFTLTPDRSTIRLASNSSTNLTTTVTNTSGIAIPNSVIITPEVQGTPIQDITIVGGTCLQNRTLASGQTCTFITQFTGKGVSGSDVTYPRFCGYGGNLCSQTIAPVDITVITNQTVNIAGAMAPFSGLPSSTSTGTPYTLTFTFTNQSSGAASGSFVIPSSNFVVSSNTCGTSSATSSLAGGSSCQVSGLFTPSTVGAHTVTMTYRYNQGSDVELNTSTTARQGPLITYVPNADNTSNGTITLCQSDTTFSNALSQCQAFQSDNSQAPFFTPVSLILNSAGTLAYISNFNGLNILRCDVNGSNGQLSGCVNTGATGTGFQPGVIIEPYATQLSLDGTMAYIVSNGDATIYKCDVQLNGDLSNCTNASPGTTLNDPVDLVFNSPHTQAYITRRSAGSILKCDVGSDGMLTNCATTATGISAPFQITFNSTDSIAYIGRAVFDVSGIFKCAVDSQGNFSQCASAGATSIFIPLGVSVNTAGNILYIADTPANAITQCDITDSSGTLANCRQASATSITQPAYLGTI